VPINHFGPDVAARYDEDSACMFAPEPAIAATLDYDVSR
jgi:hypothetical protein